MRFLKLFEQFLLEDFDFLNKERKYNSLFHYMQAYDELSDERMSDLYIKIRDKSNTLKSRKINLLDASTYPEQVQVNIPEGRWRLKPEEPKEKGAVPIPIKEDKEESMPDPIGKELNTKATRPDGPPEKPRVLISPEGEEFVDEKGRFADVKFNKKGWPTIQHLVGKRIPKYENIVDLLDIMELVEVTNKFIKLMPSHIRKEMKARQDELTQLLVHYQDYRDYKNNFLLKSNRYRTVDEFLKGLKAHIDGFKPKDKIVQAINENPNIDVFSFKKDVLIAVVYNYKGSNLMGSSSWCISYSESYWDDYVTTPARAQYFVWDFNKSNTSVESLIGITVKENNSIYTAHYKNDTSAKAYVEKQEWRNELIGMADLPDKIKIKYAVNNPRVEKKFNMISNLSLDERKKYVMEYPQLIRIISLEGFDIDDIIKMIDKDITILEFETIGARLKDIPKDKMLKLVETNLKTMKYQPVNSWVRNQLSKEEKIGLINRHSEDIWSMMGSDFNLSLYRFLAEDLSGDEIAQNFELFRTLRFEKLFLKIPDHTMRDAYRANKDTWDSELRSIGDRKLTFKAKVWNKDDERMEYERNHELYVFNAIAEYTGKKGVKEDEENEDNYEISQLGAFTLINPNNQDDHQEINHLKMRARFKGNIFTFGIWVKKGTYDSEAKVAAKSIDVSTVPTVNKEKFLV